MFHNNIVKISENLNKLMFHNNIVKISENLNKRNLLKICSPSYLPYRFLHDLHAFLLWEKGENISFFKQ